MSDERKFTPEGQMLGTKEVADREGLSRRTIRRMCERGELPAYKLGRKWRIYPDYRDKLGSGPGE